MAREEIRKIQKSGNAYYFSIPKAYLTFLGLTRKDLVIVRLFRDHITVSPYRPKEPQGGKECQEK